MKFDIPLIYDNDYIEFINKNAEHIYSIYFSLPSGNVSDARILSNNINLVQFNLFLKEIPKHIKKYITLNGRYSTIDMYSSNNIKNIISELKILYTSNNLTGILFLDFYYMTLLSQIDPKFIKELEIIPSINCNIDSLEKFNMYIQYLDSLGLILGSKIILDRSLNRQFSKLNELSKNIRKYNPNLKIEILANEGCILHCPYKINHDISISLINDKSIVGKIYLNSKLVNNDFQFQNLNDKYGCINHLSKKPEDLLKSPFIRPEDINKYNECADIIKLTGKIRSFSFLEECFNAYLNRKYNGNLIELFDSLAIFRELFYIFNDQITDNFFKKVTSCNKNCEDCNYCKDLFNSIHQILR